ncbi:5-hydroxytryptamine receptor 2A [Elysia marginata]|uniref:5-hydroxytryptamine receptor 2A n=1 Tax=Elysia marginata TaxID=1093978 RepID=A0AAV4JQ16_9GAST|nr:5-hydroxytryptamine receptor 2A [Elysia marginata]
MSPGSQSVAATLWSDVSPVPNNIYISPGTNHSLALAAMSPPLPLDLGSSSSSGNYGRYGTNLTVYNNNALAFSATNAAVQPLNWGMLGLTVIIVCTAVGNLLVCLAVCWEKRLQNMTNYFLMSLAIADFLVSLLVMPLGMVVEMFDVTKKNEFLFLFKLFNNESYSNDDDGDDDNDGDDDDDDDDDDDNDDDDDDDDAYDDGDDDNDDGDVGGGGDNSDKFEDL